MNIATEHRTHDPRPAAPRSRRRHARIHARGVASHLQTRDASIPGLPVENISMGGLFVRTSAALAEGTPVMLQVVRPGLKRAIHVTGRVVSTVSPEEARARGLVAGMGIGFDPVEGDAAERLHALLDDLGLRAPAAPAPPTLTITPVVDETFLELAEARGRLEEQEARIAQLEDDLGALRRELLRRNRTIGQLARRLGAYEEVV
jgi:Tfp pilus assembly protein PilZ